MGAWKEVWNSRVDREIVDVLLRVNGFESGGFSTESWCKYVESIFKYLGVNRGDSVYEVGSGSGAFLYLYHQRGGSVGGIDYSEKLIALARKLLPNNDFTIGEADALDSGKQFDIVFSHSVFQYFESLEYAERVVEKMVEKARRKVGVLDLNDVSKQADYHAIRKIGMSEEAYKKKYAGLDHLFFSKEWFRRLASRLGVAIEIFDQEKNPLLRNYKNVKLRFNVILTK